MNKDLLAFLITFAVVVVIIAFLSVACSITGKITSVLESPAATTNISIERLELSSDTVNITIENFSGQVNSKLIELLALGVE